MAVIEVLAETLYSTPCKQDVAPGQWDGPKSGDQGGEAMKRFIIGIFAIAVALGCGILTTLGDTEKPPKEQAMVRFNETVKLRDVFLKGDYLFVHDDARMAKGEACLYIYTADGRPVVSFHCRPVKREALQSFKVTLSRRVGSFGIPEINEVQFAGIAKAHQVP
jgi:hypothetical protein